MEYRVLARKYRPATFDDLIGQEVLVRTLSNAIKSGRIAHAFLLTGIRGVGKTTTARIIARALNCIGADGQGGPTITPCGVCPNCKMIADDRHVDVLEMDAASHTGVGDIRELIDTVRYLPTSARYKIYIVDEVHMLSTSAFNALLKTLEEPPPHVKFIFATTEARKIPVTILSRCQRFDLKRVGMELLAAHLGNIATKENVQAEEEALKLIALSAEGSVRDALSLFDQAIARAAPGEAVSGAAVRQMIGSADNAATFRLLELVLAGDVAPALAEAARQYGDGADPLLMVQDALDAVHLITRIKVAPNALNDVALSEQDRTAAKSLADRLPMPVLARLWQMFLKGLTEVRLAPSPASALEMLLVRIAYAAQLPTPAEVIRDHNSSPNRGEVGRGAQSAPPSQVSPHPNPPPNGEGIKLVSERPAIDLPQDFAQAVALFEKHREALIYTHLRNDVRVVSYAPGLIALRLISPLPRDFNARVGAMLTQWTGVPWKITLSEDEGAPTLHDQDAVQKATHLETVASDPLVVSVLEQFPGAKVVGVKTNA